MTVISMHYLRMLACVATMAGCLAAGPAPAAETLRIGGNGGSLGTMELLGAAFEKSRPDMKVTVIPSLGTNGGIRALAKGALDIGLSARPLTGEEEKLGLLVTEYARTPLVLAVSAASPLAAVGRAEFVKVLRNELHAGPDGQPLRPILRPANDAESILVRQTFPEIDSPPARTSTAHATLALTSQEAADLIEKISGAIGISTLGLIRSEQRRMKALPLDGVVPNAENTASGAYPLVMRLYLVTRPDAAPFVRAFVAFVQSESGRRVLQDAGNFAPTGK